MRSPSPDSEWGTRALRHKPPEGPPEGPLRSVLTGRRGTALSVGCAAGMMLAIAAALAGGMMGVIRVL
jgi:hypothetical protein